MGKAGTILSIRPAFAIPGAEIVVECEAFEIDPGGECGLYAGETKCHTIAASHERVMVRLPVEIEGGTVSLSLQRLGCKRGEVDSRRSYDRRGNAYGRKSGGRSFG